MGTKGALVCPGAGQALGVLLGYQHVFAAPWCQMPALTSATSRAPCAHTFVTALRRTDPANVVHFAEWLQYPEKWSQVPGEVTPAAREGIPDLQQD